MVRGELLSYKISKNFVLPEVLPPELFDNINLNPIWYLSEFLATLPQLIRDHFGKSVTINNWHSGGGFKNRGYRLPDCKEGAKLSLHKISLAIDINIEGLSQQEILSEIVKNRDKFNLITTYERISDTPGWNHFDGRNVLDRKNLIEVSP